MEAATAHAHLPPPRQQLLFVPAGLLYHHRTATQHNQTARAQVTKLGQG